eukprot:CFRG4282T1
MDMNTRLPGPLPEETLSTLKLAINAKLESLEYEERDDTLVHYIVVLVKNRHTGRQLNDDLTTFLGALTVTFTHWLCDLLLNAEVLNEDDDDDFVTFAEHEAERASTATISTTDTSIKQGTTPVPNSLVNISNSPSTASATPTDKTKLSGRLSRVSLMNSLKRQSTSSRGGAQVLTAVLSANNQGLSAEPETDFHASGHKRGHGDKEEGAAKKLHVQVDQDVTLTPASIRSPKNISSSESGTGISTFTSPQGAITTTSGIANFGASAVVGADEDGFADMVLDNVEDQGFLYTQSQLTEESQIQQICDFFPSCRFGDKCKRKHPKPTCRFDNKCTNDNCPFNHTIDFDSGGQLTGREGGMGAAIGLGENMTKYSNRAEPSTTAPPGAGVISRERMCRFDKRCTRDDCLFQHSADFGVSFMDEEYNGNNNNTSNALGGSSMDSSVGAGSQKPKYFGGTAIDSGGRPYQCRFDEKCTKLNCPFQHTANMRSDDGPKIDNQGGDGKLSQHKPFQYKTQYFDAAEQGSGNEQLSGKKAMDSAFSFNRTAVLHDRGDDQRSVPLHADSAQSSRNAIPCRFQDKCRNPHCLFTHDSNTTASGYRVGLVNGGVGRRCKFGTGCKNPNCKFSHADFTATSNQRECKFGAKCNNASCRFYHPEKTHISDRVFVLEETNDV